MGELIELQPQTLEPLQGEIRQGYLPYEGEFWIAKIPNRGDCGHRHRLESAAVACLSKWQMRVGIRRPWHPLEIYRRPLASVAADKGK